jgi:hypothetical protein
MSIAFVIVKVDLLVSVAYVIRLDSRQSWHLTCSFRTSHHLQVVQEVTIPLERR